MPPKVKKEKKIKVQPSTVELVSYSIKAVIPTGSYANVQPEIIVKAKNLEEADRFVMPYISQLYHDYARKDNGDKFYPDTYAVSQSPVSELNRSMATPTTTNYGTSGVQTTIHTADVSAPFLKAEQAINSCLSTDALEVIQRQVEKSVKLNEDEKVMLIELSAIRYGELNLKNA